MTTKAERSNLRVFGGSRQRATRGSEPPRRYAAGMKERDRIEANVRAWCRDRANTRLRNQVVEDHLRLVRQVAAKLKTSLPEAVELDELVSDGLVGLLEIMPRFRIERGVAFGAFVRSRVAGAMLDGQRRRDPIGRKARSRVKKLNAARASLSQRLGRQANDDELVEANELPADTARQAIREYAASMAISLERPLYSTGESQATLGHTLEAGGQFDATFPARHRDFLAHATRCLDERQRTIVRMYFVEGQTMKRVGHALGVSESRVCQMTARIVAHLQSLLARERVA